LGVWAISGFEGPLRLDKFQSSIALPLESRGPHTYSRRLVLGGNSLLSTLYVTSIDPGATIQVNYWEFTTGEQSGERREIASHPEMTSTNFTTISPHALIVAPFHTEPQLEAIVTGGNATFSIFITCLTSFASAQDSSLIRDGQDFDINNDLAQPVAYLDESVNKLYFLRLFNGLLPTDPIYTGPGFDIVNSTTLISGTTQLLDVYPVTTSKAILSRCKVSTFQPGRWFLEKNGQLLAAGRITSGNPNDWKDFTPRAELVTGDIITLKYTSFAGQTGSDIDWSLQGVEIT